MLVTAYVRLLLCRDYGRDRGHACALWGLMPGRPPTRFGCEFLGVPAPGPPNGGFHPSHRSAFMVTSTVAPVAAMMASHSPVVPISVVSRSTAFRPTAMP